MTKIREYLPSDKDACLDIFESNIPLYFNKNEKPLFIEWLDKTDREAYYVLINNSKIIGCGGTYYDESKKIAGLAWGMIHQKHHKNGHGFTLTKFRLEKLLIQHPNVVHRIETSQHTKLFYEKFGFKTIVFFKDGFGKGLDKYDMEKQVN